MRMLLKKNISITLTDNLVLRDNSTISARADNNANGGNIDISAEFIIAYPSDGNGNDIIANASLGKGGNIEITAESLLGIEERKSFPNNGTNDIDASSEVGGLDGTVSINTPDNQPLRETTELSDNVVVPDAVTASACDVSATQETTNSLVIKGKGGIPPEATEYLSSDSLIIEDSLVIEKDLGALDIPVSQTNNYEDTDNPVLNPDYISSHVQPVAYKDNGEPIYLARGIMKQEDGTVILTAVPNHNKTRQTPETFEACRQ